MTLTVGSLFSGIGGIDLGLERAGFEVRWQCEVDPFCRRVLRKHWPNTALFEDVTRLCDDPDFRRIQHVDLICGGFPCQDISDAGRGAGIHGSRSGLWFSMLEVIRQVRPRFVLVENVRAITHRGLPEVLGGLADSGYDAEWDSIPASYFGAPHSRERIFIVAYPSSNRLEGNGGFVLQGPYRGSLEALDAWHGTGSPFEQWEKLLAEPRRIRVDDGFAKRVDRPKQRLRAIGNAVVPQVAEYIGRRIMAACRQSPSLTL